MNNLQGRMLKIRAVKGGPNKVLQTGSGENE